MLQGVIEKINVENAVAKKTPGFWNHEVSTFLNWHEGVFCHPDETEQKQQKILNRIFNFIFCKVL